MPQLGGIYRHFGQSAVAGASLGFVFLRIFSPQTDKVVLPKRVAVSRQQPPSHGQLFDSCPIQKQAGWELGHTILSFVQ